MEGDFRIEGWLAQPRLNTLVSPTGEIVHLEPRVMDVLVFLASRPGEVFSRDDIIQSVWGDTFVTDEALGRCIAELRRVFRDPPRRSRFIRTIHRHGYSLVAAVEPPGISVDRYRDLQSLGQKADSRVFLARDTELRRQVVLKFLPGSPGDEQARRRLLREARAAARLDHPYVCKVLDIGTLRGEMFVAMEYVEGQTLAARLAGEPMDPGLAIGIALEIGEAVEHAHERGIVHRNLKPSNVILTPQGHVKVMDFGLARRLPAAGTPPGDTTAGSTHQASGGGTFPYVSPEQLRGQEEEATSDIFTFGLLLYEMAAGRHPFLGGSPVDTAAGILTGAPPPLESCRPGVPPLLGYIVRKALAKDPGRRYQLMQDLRTDLEAVRGEFQAGERQALGRVSGKRPEQRGIPWMHLAVAASLLAIIAVALIVARWRSPVPRARSEMVASVPVEEGLRLVGVPPGPAARDEEAFAQQRPTRTALSLSPDGRLLAFSAGNGTRSQIYVRQLDAGTARPLGGTDGGAAPFFSRDGRRVGFWVNRVLKAVSLDGSAPISICDVPTYRIAGVHWASEDTLVLSNRQLGIWRVNAATGKTEQITVPDTDTFHTLPHMLPGGHAMLYTRLSAHHGESPDVMLHSLKSGTAGVLIAAGSDARFVPPGHIVYARRGDLLAVPFDPARLRLTGPETLVVRGVMHSVGSWPEVHTGAAQYTLSDSGLLAYVPGGPLPDARSVPVIVDLQGRQTRIDVAAPFVECPRISPDGRRIAFSTGDAVWSCNRDGGSLERLFAADGHYLAWSGDGNGIYCEHRGKEKFGNLRLFRPGAHGLPRPLSPADAQQFPCSVSRDGGILAYVVESAPANRQVWVMRLPDGTVSQFSRIEGSHACPDISPDGTLIAYANEYQGSVSVIVEAFRTSTNNRERVRFAGREPRWSPDGKQLFFRSGTAFRSVEVLRNPALTLGRQVLLFDNGERYEQGFRASAYDPLPDGTGFLLASRVTPPGSPATRMNLVLDWDMRLGFPGSAGSGR